MRRIKKPVFFIVVVLITVFALLTFMGISTHYGDIETKIIKSTDDIRWGIDISGGVDVTFAPRRRQSLPRNRWTLLRQLLKCDL